MATRSARYSAVTVDTSGMEAKLRKIRKDQMPYAKMLTLNDLAKDTARVERLEMQTSFDRPTRFVMRGMRVLKWAKKKDPTAALSGQGGAKQYRSRYAESVKRVLGPQIEGGRREELPSEIKLRRMGVIAGGEWLIGVATDSFGNVKGPEYRKMLAYFRRRTANAQGFRYFVGRAGAQRAIYQVEGKGKPKMIWYVTTDAPTYRQRFDFYGEAQRHARRWAGYFADKAIAKAMATAR